MCGIVGIVGKTNLLNGKYVRHMAEQIKHRGPDNEGISIFKTDGTLIPNNSDEKASFGFGHRRLSIIDLTPEANQPMLKDPNKIFPGQSLRIPPQ